MVGVNCWIYREICFRAPDNQFGPGRSLVWSGDWHGRRTGRRATGGTVGTGQLHRRRPGPHPLQRGARTTCGDGAGLAGTAARESPARAGPPSSLAARGAPDVPSDRSAAARRAGTAPAVADLLRFARPGPG